mmetsp:Transcript_18287/g.32860  ORF Transcript_18287/g.32860 Transcript_18287/m.32860 type:complete len:820 (-) Transcript_18287:18-2477(-)
MMTESSYCPLKPSFPSQANGKSRCLPSSSLKDQLNSPCERRSPLSKGGSKKQEKPYEAVTSTSDSVESANLMPSRMNSPDQLEKYREARNDLEFKRNLSVAVTLLAKKRLPCKHVTVYPFPIEDLDKPYKHLSLPGAMIESLKNIVLVTVCPKLFIVEFYTQQLKWPSSKINRALEWLNQQNSISCMKVSLCPKNSSIRATNTFFTGYSMSDTQLAEGIWSWIRSSSAIFKRTVADFQYYTSSLAKIPFGLSIAEDQAQKLLKKFAIRRRLQPADLSLPLLFCINDGEAMVECEMSIDSFKIDLCMNITPLAYTLNNTFGANYNSVIQNLSLGLELCRLQSLNGCLMFRSQHLYSKVSSRNFSTLLSRFYEASLDEYYSFTARAQRVLSEKDQDFIEIAGVKDEVIDSTVSSSESCSIEETFTHFKAFSNESERRLEKSIIRRLNKNSLLENYGLNDSDCNDDSDFSLTFHTPDCKSFSEALQTTEDAKLGELVEGMTKLIKDMQEVGLQFHDFSTVKLYWNESLRSSKETGVSVFCTDYLHQIIDITDTPTDPHTQTQEFLLGRIKESKAKKPAPDINCIEFDTSLYSGKFSVLSIPGVKKACIYRKSLEGLTTAETFDLCDKLHQQYAVNRHPALLKSYGYKLEEESIYFAYENCKTSLYSHIMEGKRLPDTVKFLKELASGLGYLSSKAPQEVNIHPKRIMISASHSPKMMPYFYKEPCLYGTIKQSSPSKWRRSLIKAFGLIARFVISGVEIEQCEDFPASPIDLTSWGADRVMSSSKDFERGLCKLCFDEQTTSFTEVLRYVDGSQFCESLYLN